MRLASALVVGTTLVMLGVAPARAGIEPLPPRTEIDTFTCRELLGLPPEPQERALIYLSGVTDGRRRAAVYDAEATGGVVERVLTACQAAPSLAVLEAFRAAW